MLIRCPKCNTGFNLPENKIPDKGAKVKCSACVHTFRVRLEDGQPVFFYKKGEAPSTGETMIGAPIDLGDMDFDGGVGDEESEKTQFGFQQRSRSADVGYDPFPLAGRVTSENAAVRRDDVANPNDRTHMLGGGVTTPVEDIPIMRPSTDNDRTQLGPQGLAEESRARTKVATQALPAEAKPAEDGDSTRAFGSGGLDLFDGPPPERPAPPPSDFDPFGDAFDASAGDVGLLMPSTPIPDEPSHPNSGLSLESSSEVGMTEEEFLLGGGGGSDFGDAASLVDNSFGEDVPSFDAHSGVVDLDKRPSTGRRPSLPNLTSNSAEIGLQDVRTDERARSSAPKASRPKAARPEPARPDPRPAPAPEPRSAPERPRPVPVYAQNAAIGATSPLRRTFDVIFTALVVIVAFVALVGARAGGFVDFARFGHMIEVAFAGTEFAPREEWKQIVEIPPPDPPPDEPLRLENVRAFEKDLGGKRVLIVAGRVRNYSLSVFKGVKVRGEVTQGEKKLAEKTQTVGQAIDRKKLGAASSMVELDAAITKKLPDLGKEGTTYFAIVFDGVPADVLASGNFDFSAAVVD